MKYRVKRHTVVQPLDQSYRLIPLTQGKNAIVDASDYESLSTQNWFALRSKTNKTFYAMRNVSRSGKRNCIAMHQEILKTNCGIDHKNRNGLDNRRMNLRMCTATENGQNQTKHKRNTSGFKGVSLNKKTGTWVAQITSNGKRYCAGYHASAEAAARAYDEMAKTLHGEFAVLNFP